MAKVKYYAKENSSIGTHSFYAVPIPNGTLTFDELLDEAMDGKSVEPSIAKACVTEFMKAVKRNVLKGFRCQLGDNFLTVYSAGRQLPDRLSQHSVEREGHGRPADSCAHRSNRRDAERSQRQEPTGLHRSRQVQPPVL